MHGVIEPPPSEDKQLGLHSQRGAGNIEDRFLAMWHLVQSSFLVVAGSALFWTWAFAWALNNAAMPDHSYGMQNAYLSSMAAYIIVAIIIFVRFLNGKSTHTRGRIFAFAGAAVVATGIELFGPRLLPESATSLLLMSCMGLANGAALLYLSISWGARYAASGSHAGITIVSSLLIAFVCNALLATLPALLSAFFVVVFPAVSTVLWYIDAFRRQESTGSVWMVEELDSRDMPGEALAGEANPRILPWGTLSVLSAIGFLANFFNAVSLSVQNDSGFITGSFVLAAVMCTIWCLIVWKSRQAGWNMSLRASYLLLVPMTVLALLLILLDGGAVKPEARMVLMASAFLLHVVIWVQLAQVTVIEGVSPLVAFGIGGVLVTALQILGNLMGSLVISLSFSSDYLIALCAACAVMALAFATALLLYSERDDDMRMDRASGNNRKSRQDGTGGVNFCTNVRSVSSADKSQSEIIEDEADALHSIVDEQFEQSVAAFSRNYGLSERETEVFAWFARGRNIPYIAEKLFVTSGTVKTHSNHIFQKTGVVNRQQLLDLFEKQSKS